METEIWKDIKGYEGRYAVSNLGRVKSLPRVITVQGSGGNYKYKGKILKNSMDSYGYLRVTLSDKEFKQKVKKVHILVAEAFVEKEDPTHVNVTIADGDKENVRADNLKWVTENYTAVKGINITIEKRYGKNKEEI